MEPRRDADRDAPGDIRLPARVAQIIGDRGERVVLAVPDVGIPVPVAVHGQAKVDGGEELGIAGGAGPTALQAAARDAAVDKLQGRDELVREESPAPALVRSEEHTSELQSLMRISYAVFCLKKKNKS